MASQDLPDDERPFFPEGFKRTSGRYSKSGDSQYLLDTSIAWALHGFLQRKDPANAALNMVLWHQIVGLGGDPGTTFNIPLSMLRSRGIDSRAIEKSLGFLMQLGILVFAWMEPPSKAVLRYCPRNSRGDVERTRRARQKGCDRIRRKPNAQ